MIEIKDKRDCCGCSACVQKCPKQCISLKDDNEGFLYPEVDKVTCIDCGKEFSTNAKNNQTNRCDMCRKLHETELARLRKQRQREREKQ